MPRAFRALRLDLGGVYDLLWQPVFRGGAAAGARDCELCYVWGGQVPATFLGGVIAQLWGERAIFLVAVGAAALGMLFMTRAEQPRSTQTQWLLAQDFWQLLKNCDLDFDAKEKSESFQSKRFGFLSWWSDLS